jgi:hypothetical protein
MLKGEANLTAEAKAHKEHILLPQKQKRTKNTYIIKKPTNSISNLTRPIHLDNRAEESGVIEFIDNVRFGIAQQQHVPEYTHPIMQLELQQLPSVGPKAKMSRRVGHYYTCS